MNTDPVVSLREATQKFVGRWRAGNSVRSALEEFYETALGVLSRLRGQSILAPEAQEALQGAVNALLECGEAVFAADHDATRTLDEVMKAAKHLAGILPPQASREARFEELSRQWYWRTMG